MRDLRSEAPEDPAWSDPAWLEALRRDPAGAGRSPRQQALCRYAVKITRDPHGATRDDLDALRAHGLADADLLDAVQVIGFFNYINRVASALGVPDEPDW